MFLYIYCLELYFKKYIVFRHYIKYAKFFNRYNKKKTITFMSIEQIINKHLPLQIFIFYDLFFFFKYEKKINLYFTKH